MNATIAAIKELDVKLKQITRMRALSETEDLDLTLSISTEMYDDLKGVVVPIRQGDVDDVLYQLAGLTSYERGVLRHKLREEFAELKDFLEKDGSNA